MIRLRKEALSLASQEDWEPVFNLIQEPSDSKWCWLMTNEMGTLRFSLTHDMTVADLHRRFAKMMNHLDHSEGDECEICYKHTKRISCTKCNNMICRECYISLFQEGHGIITCPYCRTQHGTYRLPHQVLSGVAQIRQKIDDDDKQHGEAQHNQQKNQEQAKSLFAAAIAACNHDDDPPIPNPALWIANKVQLRESWEKYKADMGKLPQPMFNIMMNNEFAQYMEFMYALQQQSS